ncbi:MAG: carboxylesterase [Aliiglaciecola sp.]
MSDNLLPFVEVNPDKPHDAVVIWLHGLGDSGNGFAPIVPELNLPKSLAIRFVFPHAPVRPVTINNGMPMRAWYDIKSLDFNQRADVEGVLESAEQVSALVDAEIAKGVPSERILLAGFSQGGVIALHLGTRFPQKLAGIMALSTYMSQPESLTEQAHSANKQTEIFCAHGQQDEVVPMFLGHAAFKTLEQNGYPVQWHEYNMQHNVCLQEIEQISTWIQKVFS